MLLRRPLCLILSVLLSTYPFLEAAAQNPELWGPDPQAQEKAIEERARFLLREREDPKHILTEPEPEPELEPVDFDVFLNKLKTFRFSQTRWNEMREALEKGLLPEEVPPYAEPQPPLVQLEEPGPKPPPPELELPTYGTSLSITGRKIIRFNFSSKKFLKEQTTSSRPRSQSSFDLDQELQVRMQGKVGPKIAVNVDFDDTKEDKQDISVVYQGDPEDVVQGVSFGDIDLSLPSTEFLSFNKQLFGIRTDLKYRRTKFSFIGSRTKGQTKSKRFVGNTQLVQREILDTGYIRRRFYDLSFGNPAFLPIKTGSEIVLRDDKNPNNDNANTQSLTVEDFAVPSSTFTGKFDTLTRGQDYVVDYVKGTLEFRNSLDANAVVAIDFTRADGTKLSAAGGGTGKNKLLKTPNDLKLVSDSEAGPKRELKTFYFVGQTRIVRDNGQGNFILQARDKNRTDVGASLSPPQQYPNTISMDFEDGIFQLQEPFGGTASPDANIYAPTPTSKFTFFLEYRFQFKTFFLEPSLVLQSERVFLDGRRLARNADYFIDYDAGFITFFNEGQIRESSVIDISYEVKPFGAAASETLLGARLEQGIFEKWDVGSTVFFNEASKPPSTPDIRSLPRSLLVYELDTHFKDLRLGNFLRSNLSGEIAQSVRNPNTVKKALVDNMEGIKQEDAATVDRNFWFLSSNPGPMGQGGFRGAHADAVTIGNQDVKVTEINPDASDTGTQQVLTLAYDFSKIESSTLSIVDTLSKSGLDFSKKSFLELVVSGGNPDTELNLHLGTVDEDADGNGIFDTEDDNNDQILNPGEDDGYTYGNPDATAVKIGAANGRLDSEDLDGNGKLDPQDFSGGDFGFTQADPGLFDATTQSTITAINFASTWHTFQINISSAIAADPGRWAAIKQIRLSLRRKPGGTNNTGTIRIARLAAVGNSWENGVVEGSGELDVSAINNVDNPTYKPLFSAGGEAQAVFDDLNESSTSPNVEKKREQALALTFRDLAPGTTAYTRRLLTRNLDFSSHKELRFLAFNDPNNPPLSGDVFLFFRFGSSSDFFEYRVPLGASWSQWKLFTIKLVDDNDDDIPDRIENGTPTGFSVFISSSGRPNLQQISEMRVGVLNKDSASICTAQSCSVWFNELHMKGPLTRRGTAFKVAGDFEVPNWMTLGGKWREVDRRFETLTTVVTNRDEEIQSGYMNFSRLRFLPMSFDLSRTETRTPDVSLTGLSNLVSILEEGKTVHWTGNARGTLSLPRKMPALGLGFSRDRNELNGLDRIDDKKSYSASTNYALPWQGRILPTNVGLRYGLSHNQIRFGDISGTNVARLISGNDNRLETTQEYEVRMNFAPWRGTTWNPSYSLIQVEEERTTLNADLSETIEEYDKSLSQTVGFNSRLQLTDWFIPNLNYSITTLENNLVNLSTTSVLRRGEIKNVTRNSSSEVSLATAFQQIWPGSKLLRTLNVSSSYRLEDGDLWENVENGLDSKTALWIRSPLDPKNPSARRLQQTLRDTLNLIFRWSPFQAYRFTRRLSPFQTLSLADTFTQSTERKDVTGSASKTITTNSPDLVATLNQVETLFFSESWMANSQANARFSQRETETIGAALREENNLGFDLRFLAWDRYSTNLTYNTRGSEDTDLRAGVRTQRTSAQDFSTQSTFDSGIWRLTPRLDYQTNESQDGTGRFTAKGTILTPSLIARADLSLPSGLRIPFLNRTLSLTNRFILNSTLKFERKRSPVAQTDNSDTASLDFSGDYEVAQNLRLTLAGGISRLWHKFLKQEDFLAYNFATTLTFQF